VLIPESLQKRLVNVQILVSLKTTLIHKDLGILLSEQIEWQHIILNVGFQNKDVVLDIGCINIVLDDQLLEVDGCIGAGTAKLNRYVISRLLPIKYLYPLQPVLGRL